MKYYNSKFSLLLFFTFIIFTIVACQSVSPKSTPTPSPTRRPTKPLIRRTLPTRPFEAVATLPTLDTTFFIQNMMFIDASHGWAIGLTEVRPGERKLVVQATDDGGKTWHKVGQPELGNSVGIHFFNLKDGWIWGDVFFVTHDGGLTWEKKDWWVKNFQAIGDTVWAIQDSNCTQTAKCNQALKVSPNQGETWQSTLSLPSIDKYWQIEHVDLHNVWISARGQDTADNSFAVSQDGNAWRFINTPCASKGLDANDLFPLTPEHLWLYCSSDNPATIMLDKYIFESYNDGKSWNLIAAAPYPGSAEESLHNLPLVGYTDAVLVLSPQRAFIAMDRSGIITSRDGGHTWADAIEWQGDMGSWQLTFADELHGWASIQFMLWGTTNGGMTWQQITPP